MRKMRWRLVGDTKSIIVSCSVDTDQQEEKESSRRGEQKINNLCLSPRVRDRRQVVIGSS